MIPSPRNDGQPLRFYARPHEKDDVLVPNHPHLGHLVQELVHLLLVALTDRVDQDFAVPTASGKVKKNRRKFGSLLYTRRQPNFSPTAEGLSCEKPCLQKCMSLSG